MLWDLCSINTLHGNSYFVETLFSTRIPAAEWLLLVSVGAGLAPELLSTVTVPPSLFNIERFPAPNNT